VCVREQALVLEKEQALQEATSEAARLEAAVQDQAAVRHDVKGEGHSFTEVGAHCPILLKFGIPRRRICRAFTICYGFACTCVCSGDRSSCVQGVEEEEGQS
jgi:hypothetical protein